VVSVFATGPKGRWFKPGQDDERETEIRRTPSLGWEIKPKVLSRKTLRHVKDPLTY
jgi:hypothetical protein